jgi:hypothetical protein
MQPFPHIVIHNALRKKVYKELSNSYPADKKIIKINAWRTGVPGQNKRVDLCAKDIKTGSQNIPNIWVDFVNYHTSEAFYHRFRDVFEHAIKKYYPDLLKTLDSMPSPLVGTRFHDNDSKPLSLDCQIGINTACPIERSVIGPHVDDPVELYAGLLYFKRPNDTAKGGNLEICRWKRFARPRFEPQMPQLAIQSHVKRVATIEYAPNTLVFFLNTLDSVHSVTPRSASTVSRRLVNIIGEVYNMKEKGLFDRRKLIRHPF